MSNVCTLFNVTYILINKLQLYMCIIDMKKNNSITTLIWWYNIPLWEPFNLKRDGGGVCGGYPATLFVTILLPKKVSQSFMGVTKMVSLINTFSAQ